MELDTGAQGGAGVPSVSQGAGWRDQAAHGADHLPPLDGVHPGAD